MQSDSIEGLSQRFALDNPVYRRIFLRLPPDIAGSFTAEQLEAIHHATAHRGSSHSLVLRQRIPLFSDHRYLAVSFGVDRRRKLNAIDMFVLRGLRTSGWQRALMLAAGAAAVLVAFTLAVLLAYAVKSGLGLDLTDGPSFLHDIVFVGR